MLALGISSTSCVKIYLKAMGVQKTRTVSKEVLTNYLQKRGINHECILEVDSVKYAQLIEKKKIDTLYKHAYWWTQNHIQPVQVIYFEKATQRPIAAYFNCIAEVRGLTSMTWNKEHELEFFPPKTYTNWVDTLFSQEELFKTFNDMNGKEFKYKDDGTEYLIVIFYSLFVQKQSDNLIKEVNEHLQKCLNNNYQIYYVNMDNYFFKEVD